MSNRRRAILACAVLTLLVVFIYAQVGDFDFVNYDDHRYITLNERVLQGLTVQNVAWAFTTFDVANWHPLTWLSHMVDMELFGLANPGGHHLVNVLLHLANALMLLVILHRMTGAFWRAALVAALFTVHPLHVESVAWISERKDVLSTLMGLIAIWCYVRYAEKRSMARMSLVVVFFSLSLMAKPMFVTLPFMLLLLDVWPLRRAGVFEMDEQVQHGRSRAKPQAAVGCNGRWVLIIEKLPLIALSIASCAITMMAQARGGAISGIDAVPLSVRAGNTVVSYVTYIRQMFWPGDLTPLYPLDNVWPVGWVILAAAGLVFVSFICAALFRHAPHLLVGWLLYLGTLVPVIGIVQVGSQAHADRYTYFPLVGLFIMAAWSVANLSARAARFAVSTALTSALIAFSVTARHQCAFWCNSITLSKHALDVNPGNAVAHFNLANALVARDAAKDLQSAIDHLREAARLKPNWTDVNNNLGNAYMRANQVHEAINAYSAALNQRPEFPEALCNLGVALARAGQLDEAAASLQHALQIRPQYADAHLALGNVYARQNRLEDAIGEFQASLEINPNNPITHLSLGNALARANHLEEAIDQFARSIRLDPNQPHAHMSMATALAGLGRRDEALAHLAAAAELAQAAHDGPLLQELQRRMQSLQTP